MTSGSKGIHLYAALDGSQSSDQISEFAHELARSLEADHPELAVSDMKKTLRAGKVLVDWSQNNAAKTTIVPYSLRGRLRPTVAAPRTWRELSSPSLHHLDFQEVMKRVAAGKDPFAPVSGGRHGAGAATARTVATGRPPARRRAETSPSRPATAATPTRGWKRTAPNGTGQARRDPARRNGTRPKTTAGHGGRSSSSRSTTPAGSTTTSGWNATAYWCPGRCPRASRPARPRTTSRSRPRTTRWTTPTSRVSSPKASTAPGPSASGTADTYECEK